MRTYAQAYGQWHRQNDLDAAQNIHRYIRAFLTSPDGAFYVSQDADLVAGRHSANYFALNDAKRRALGVPRVDKHLYARENGWMIRALLLRSTRPPGMRPYCRRPSALPTG